MACTGTLVLQSPTGSRLCRGRRVSIRCQQKFVRVPSTYKAKEKKVDGDDWFSVTKRAAQGVSKNQRYSSGGDDLLEQKLAARKAQVKRYVDREDLYAGNWEGDRYVGSRFNVLNVLLLIAIGTPLFGLLFAYLTYGTVWG